MKSKVLGFLAVGLLAGPMAVSAATVTTASCNGSFTCATGVTGVVVGGTTYDASVLFGDFYDDSVFDFFGDQAGALDAANQILAAMIAAGAIGATNSGISYQGAIVGYAGDPNLQGFRGYNTNGTTQLVDDLVWARMGQLIWDFRVVPEPGTLALLGLGLAGLGLSRRRKSV